jgi:hypothetical protein
MIAITKEEAHDMLRIIEASIEIDQFTEIDLKDIDQLERFLARAKLHQTLTNTLYQQSRGAEA